MNRDTLKGQWKQLKGEIQSQWGRLTNDDLDVIEGEYSQLVGRLQERYGHSRDEAEREIDEFLGRHRSFS
jgi:uncharacterized protein YjbJ (UPF0337 family)